MVLVNATLNYTIRGHGSFFAFQSQKVTDSEKIYELFIGNLRAKLSQLPELIKIFENTLNSSVAEKLKEFQQELKASAVGNESLNSSGSNTTLNQPSKPTSLLTFSGFSPTTSLKSMTN